MSLKSTIKKGIACDSVGKPESILGRAVCLSVHPGKMAIFPFLHWFETRYRTRYTFARTIFAIDMILLGLAIGLGLVIAILLLFQPSSFEDGILFDATVAPREIVSGAPSTLVIRYTNTTDETLRNASLRILTPDHFLLQETSVDDQAIQDDQILLGDIPIGGTGTVRLRGVMFGDVGGEQTFTSLMRFIHGEDTDIAGEKSAEHTFSPVQSTLALTLHLPERLVAFQPMSGTVTYENTGEIEFPEIHIEPIWPEGFTFSSSDFTSSEQSGTFSFNGYLGDVGEEVTFIFDPSFVFGDTRYTQERLTHTAPVVPPQIQTTISTEETSARPGSNLSYTLSYTNTGETDVTDVVLGIETDSPLATTSSTQSESIPSIAPGETGTIDLSLPLRSSINSYQTDTYTNLELTVTPTATYTLADDDGQRVSTQSSSLTLPITSPVILESFGRYTTDSGDQLGRGPLPPRTNIETKYWVIWRLSGTTNTLNNVQIHGDLAEGVRFTGRQTVSLNSGAQYDPSTNSMTWSSLSIDPTLDPASKVIAVAFELGITPTTEMIDTSPTLMHNIVLTGTDANTGAFISTSGSPITTDLPNDLMAAGKSIVK